MARPLSLIALVASVAAMCATMVLGPSDAVPFFGSTGPFLTLHASPSHAVVTALTWFAALSAGAGTLAGLYALRRGRLAGPGRLLAAGIVTACVFALLPPAGSVDILNYAIYGRIADLGRDPYVTTPFLLARTGDRVGVLLPSGWQRVPTVYGPVTTAIQWAAAHVGAGSMARIIFLLKWANAAAFAGTAVLLDRLAGPDPVRRVRACLLWTVNPIMLFWMVGSGHADVFAVFFLVLALWLLRRPSLLGILGGAAGGAAVAVKASFLFPAAALVAVAWFGPARIRRSVAAVLGLLLVAGGGYLLAGPAAVHSLHTRLGRKKDRYLPVPDVILNHHGLYAVWMALLAVALTAFLWWRSGLPFAVWRRVPDTGLLPVAVLAFGTTLVSPLQYPWYDAMLLPLLAVLPLRPYARLDGPLVVRGVMLAVMTLPGVRVDGYQHLAVRWLNLVWLLVFAGAVWHGTRRRRVEPPAAEPVAEVPAAGLSGTAVHRPGVGVQVGSPLQVRLEVAQCGGDVGAVDPAPVGDAGDRDGERDEPARHAHPAGLGDLAAVRRGLDVVLPA
ncbi:hypothetical protein Airi02_090540 [Actinoallomurus iriomotensis]|uniref:DUF2029 domain-containing protein n=1 Tax=Actinoallomurus iriomotensis TaxID=478107 RepID=A0A9W6SA54_9ACTN|nr:hypothetical protein Airi02_090540 [Actinoallomurus iriomotensis]